MFEEAPVADVPPATEKVVAAELSDEEQLHARCGVYTTDEVVEKLLDAIGWTADVDLTEATLLEPSAGNGAFVVAAARRLLGCMAARGLKATRERMLRRITACELLDREAEIARSRVRDELRRGGVEAALAIELAATWIRTEDFLLHPPTASFTHVVGNPPYCRWSRVPAGLRRRYEKVLPASSARGDIFLPFLDRAVGLLVPDGLLGFVCSDRWKYMAFAEQFRRTQLPNLDILVDAPVKAASAFVRPVDAYSSLFVVRRRAMPKPAVSGRARPRTLLDAGYRVRVGPALGCTAAFVVEREGSGVEEELLAPWVNGTDILEDRLREPRHKVIVSSDPEGRLRDLPSWPGAARVLNFHRAELEQRAVVRVSGRRWYAPIDRVRASDWSRPKILVPELARKPRFAVDLSGAIPSHGVYAVFAPDDDLTALQAAWSEGGLARALDPVSPRVKGGYLRCYKRFLEALPLEA